MKTLEFVPGTIKVVDGVQYTFQEVYEFRATGGYAWYSEKDPDVRVVHMEDRNLLRAKQRAHNEDLKEAAYKIIEHHQLWVHVLQQVKKGMTRPISGVGGETALEHVIKMIREDVQVLAQAVLLV